MIEEEWRDIAGFEGKYAVSNYGRVKSLERVDRLGRLVKEKILSLCKDRCGYLCVNLYKGGKPKMYKVHRLVLMTFSPCTDSESLQVNHRNEKKDCNRLENLEWVTCKENNNHGTRNKRISKKMTNGKLSIPIAQLSLDGKFIKAYKSSMDAQREEVGFNHSSINDCCKGRLKTHKGFRWMYLSEYMDKYNGIIE